MLDAFLEKPHDAFGEIGMVDIASSWKNLYTLIRKLDEKTSVIISTDLEFGVWVAIFGYSKMTTAPLVRVTQYCTTIKTGNKSYRFAQSKSHREK